MERKWTDRQYHVQDNAAFAHQDVIMYRNKNQFLALTFCGPHYKPYGVRGLSKYYNFRFDTKLGNAVCAIRRMPCAYIACTSMLDKPWISGLSSDEQEPYKPVTNITYWPVLGSFNNWNIIKILQKSTLSDEFDEIHQVVLDGISDNTASLFESGNYGAINTTYTSTNGFYAIMFT